MQCWLDGNRAMLCHSDGQHEKERAQMRKRGEDKRIRLSGTETPGKIRRPQMNTAATE